MTIVQRGNSWQVAVSWKMKRVRLAVRGTKEEAQDKHDEITRSLKKYGTWPPSEGTTRKAPLTPHYHHPDHAIHIEKKGTIGKAGRYTLDHAWKDTRYKGHSYLYSITDYLINKEGLLDLNEVTKQHIDKFVSSRIADGIAPSTINKYLSALKICYDTAMNHTPPLCTRIPQMKRVRNTKVLKWWLQPERMTELLAWCRGPGMLYETADVIELICRTGLRVEEALALTNEHRVGPHALMIPGTKTKGAQATIPISKEAAELLARRAEGAGAGSYSLLFPIKYRQLAYDWDACRAFLGAEDVPTATLKSLRRTFAKLAEDKGLSTETIRKILRHESITTTQEYLRLVGREGDLEEIARKL